MCLEVVVSLVERTIGLKIEKSFAELKALLLKKDCIFVAEEAPRLISVRHGSLWGVSPLTAKKLLKYRLSSVDSGTRITCSSSLASDWKNLTIFGSLLGIVVAFMFMWIAIDLNFHLTTQQQSWLSWIVTVNGLTAVQMAQTFADLLRIFAVLLLIILVAEMIVVVNVHFKINAFADESLNALY